MKKNKILVFLLILFICAIPTTNAKAITASMSCSSQSSVTLGNTISVTIRGNASEAGYWEGMMSYDSSKLQLISGSARIFDESASASKSYSYTFKLFIPKNTHRFQPDHAPHLAKHCQESDTHQQHKCHPVHPPRQYDMKSITFQPSVHQNHGNR